MRRPLLSFEEHNYAPTAIDAATQPADGSFTNEFLLHLPPVLNIVVLDFSHMGITMAQMELALRFKQFLAQLPADKPLAGSVHASANTFVLFQNFCSAITRCCRPPPTKSCRITHSATDHYNDLDLLSELTQQLTQIQPQERALVQQRRPMCWMRRDPNQSQSIDVLRTILRPA